MERKKLKQYKLVLRGCGPEFGYSKIIKAYSKREATEKYMQENHIDWSEETCKIYESNMVEHIPKPRKRKAETAG